MDLVVDTNLIITLLKAFDEPLAYTRAFCKLATYYETTALIRNLNIMVCNLTHVGKVLEIEARLLFFDGGLTKTAKSLHFIVVHARFVDVSIRKHLLGPIIVSRELNLKNNFIIN